MDNRSEAGGKDLAGLVDDSGEALIVGDDAAALTNEEKEVQDVASMTLDPDLEPMVLTMDDLFPDANGEVVITTEDGLPISLVSESEPTDKGIIDSHVTAAGIDVSGLEFCTFESGLTVYFESDSMIQITSEPV